ncbi:MAG: Kdo hydroxylase family protein [SAR324 cluster bacterium]|nr:Kdo hydroxylase family protein [SAR324 cluster bacterium]MCZ6532417.1 Kdo hydroxylase family protein [SAR324 cluster bacterium]
MLATYKISELESLGPRDLFDQLEMGNIVYFPKCPIPLPNREDLQFLREELPQRLVLKNISYHPEIDAVMGLKTNRDTVARVTSILKNHSQHIREFLMRVARPLVENWRMGTCSFRPMEERGRNLKPHASNELIHIDAGAYGATHGDRIFRFFVNVNPSEPREWASKGSFAHLFQRHAEAAGILPEQLKGGLEPGLIGRLYSGGLTRLARAGLPIAQLADSSPYDRTMRKFHNYMKDNREFKESSEGLEHFSFPPFSAWMVFTDGVSHSVLSGQFTLVQTCIVPMVNCRMQELVPMNIIKKAAV